MDKKSRKRIALLSLGLGICGTFLSGEKGTYAADLVAPIQTDTTFTEDTNISIPVGYTDYSVGAVSAGAGVVIDSSADHKIGIHVLDTSLSPNTVSTGISAERGGRVELLGEVAIENANRGIYAYKMLDTHEAGKVTVGDNLKISGGTSVALLSENGGEIIVGDGAHLSLVEDKDRGYSSDYSATVNAKRDVSYSLWSTIIIGKNAVIENHYDYEGSYLYAINTDRGSYVTVGENSVISTDVRGNGSHSNHAIMVEGVDPDDVPAEVNIGGGTLISTTSDSSHGLVSRYGAFALIGGKSDARATQITTSGNGSYGVNISEASVELGDGLEIQTSGDDGIGIYNYNGSIITGDGVKITTSGEWAHGIETSYGWETTLGEEMDIRASGFNAHGILAAGSKVSIGDKATIHATGQNAVAVFANGNPAYESSWPTSIEFLGGATIVADSAKDGLALYGYAGQITSKLDDTGNVINDQDGGNFQIIGDMKTETDGKIDMYLGTGSLFIGSADQGNGYIHLHMQEGSTWYVTKDKNANVCLDEGAHLYLGHPDNWSGFTKAAFVPVTIKNAEVMTANGGTINFRTDIASQQADYLILEKGIAGPGGYVSVANQGSAATTGSEIVPLMDDAIPAATPAQFALTNTVELGGYNYVLNQRDDGNGGIEWYLEGVKSLTPDKPNPPVITDPGSAAVNIFSGAYLLNYAETQTLLKRLGDLRGGTQDNGVWARVYGGKFQSSGDSFLRGFDMDYWGMQTGYDKKIEREDKRGTVYVGGFFGYSKGDLDYLNNGSGSIDSKSLGAYWTHIHRNGFYADVVLKYNWMKNDFKQLDSAGSWVKGSDINTQGFTGSLEVGRRYFLKTKENGEKIRVEDRQGWYVEPQFQLTLGHQGGGSFTASNGLRIKADAHRSVMARVETHLGYEVKSGKNPVNVYAKLGVVKEFDGEVDYTLNGSRESTSYGDTWKLWGLGVTAKFAKKHDVYLEVERATGGQFTQSWAINGGYRFSW